MTHRRMFAHARPGNAPDPRPGCPGVLDLVGRCWSSELVEVMAVTHLYRCRACRAFVGQVGDDPVWVKPGE